MRKMLFVFASLLLVMVVKAQSVESPNPDLDVKVLRATYAGGKVLIDLLLTNFVDDTQIDIGGEKTMAVDDEGNTYDYSKVVVTKADGSGVAIGTSIDLPNEIGVKAKVRISNVDRNATGFQIIKLKVYANGGLQLSRNEPIVLKNISFEK